MYIARAMLGIVLRLSVLSSLAAGARPDRAYLTKRDGIEYNVFEHGATGSKLEFVKNSGVCETTEGVNSYSGYLTVGPNMNMFFWYGTSVNHMAPTPYTYTQRSTSAKRRLII
jgi:hypothetical protein